MSYVEKIKALAARVPKTIDLLHTENALVMPFIAALGYDVFDPTEVTPELSTNDEVTTVIVCNDRTPEVCVRVLPDTLRTVEETRAWAQRLNETLDAQTRE